MLCKQCQTIFPNYYKACPNCKSTVFERERFAPIEEKEETIQFSPFAESGEIDIEEME